MSKNLRLEKCILDKNWDNFLEKSPDQSIFLSKIYLESLNTNLGLYKCLKGEEIRALVALCEDNNKKNIVSNDFLIYSGICFGAPTNNQNYPQQISERHNLTNFMIGELVSIYDSLDFQLVPNFDDIRPFQWHNYNQEFFRKFSVEIRYTSYLDIQHLKNIESQEPEQFLKNLSSTRRQEIRWSIKNKIQTKISDDVELFISFYKKTFGKSHIQISSELEKNLSYLVDSLITSKKAKMYISYSNNNEPASIALIGFDKLRAYYLFGANNPKITDQRTGTAVLWHAFKELSANGVTQVDLEGVNSPQRGWFKLSFGGKLIPYFRIIYPK